MGPVSKMSAGKSRELLRLKLLEYLEAIDRGGWALLRYVLRPPIAQERVERQKGGLVRIALKRA